MKFKTTMRTLALAIAIMATGATAIKAQTNLAPISQAELAKLTPAQIALGKEVVMLSGIFRTFNAFVPTIMQQIFNTVTPTRPELRKDLEDTLKGLMPEYEKRTEEMIEHTARLFAAAMSEPALKATIEFMKSDAGRQYIEMQPRVIDQMVVAVDDWNRKLADEILARARAEMKKKGRDM